MSEFYTHVGHLYGITSPIANAGGPVKTIEDVDAMARTQVGWVEGGSYTYDPRPDLSEVGEVTYIYNEKTGELFNKFEMPNQGFDQLWEDVPTMLDIAHGHRKPLVINVAPTSETPGVEIAEMVSELHALNVDALLINPDCPSLIGSDGTKRERMSKNPDKLGVFLREIKELTGGFKPVFLRVAPPETRAHFIRTIDVIRRSGIVSALFVANTWEITTWDIRSQPELEVWGGAGGKSGPAVAHRSANVVKWAVEALQGSRIDVVRSGGVSNAKEVRMSLNIGAVASAGSALFFEAAKNEGWLEATERILGEI